MVASFEFSIRILDLGEVNMNKEKIYERLHKALQSMAGDETFERRVDKAETAWVQGDLEYADQLLRLIGY